MNKMEVRGIDKIESEFASRFVSTGIENVVKSDNWRRTGGSEDAKKRPKTLLSARVLYLLESCIC